MASLHGFVSASKFLNSIHLGLTPPHYQILNATAAKHGLTPRQSAPTQAGGTPRTWFRRSELDKLADEVIAGCKAIAKNPDMVGKAHPYSRRPSSSTKAEDGNGNATWPSASVAKRVAAQKAAKRRRVKGKPVRRNPLAQSPRRDSVLLSVPYGSNKTLLVTMEEGRQIHSHLDSVFTDE